MVDKSRKGFQIFTFFYLSLVIQNPLFILLLITINTFGQQVRIDTLLLPPGNRFGYIQMDQLKFPIIKTSDSQVDALINMDLKNRFTDNIYPELPSDSTLIKWADEQIIFLDFETTYNSHNIISLSISAEGCGAYCTGWTSYFNYSTLTGDSLSIQDIVNLSDGFIDLVMTDKNKQYAEQKETLYEWLMNPDFELDEDTYVSVLEYYNNCDDSFEINTFSLFPDYLEIIAYCYLPNVAKNLTPFIELKYKYQDINEYLKIKLD